MRGAIAPARGRSVPGTQDQVARRSAITCDHTAVGNDGSRRFSCACTWPASACASRTSCGPPAEITTATMPSSPRARAASGARSSTSCRSTIQCPGRSSSRAIRVAMRTRSRKPSQIVVVGSCPRRLGERDRAGDARQRRRLVAERARELVRADRDDRRRGGPLALGAVDHDAIVARRHDAGRRLEAHLAAALLDPPRRRFRQQFGEVELRQQEVRAAASLRDVAQQRRRRSRAEARSVGVFSAATASGANTRRATAGGSPASIASTVSPAGRAQASSRSRRSQRRVATRSRQGECRARGARRTRDSTAEAAPARPASARRRGRTARS